MPSIKRLRILDRICIELYDSCDYLMNRGLFLCRNWFRRLHRNLRFPSSPKSILLIRFASLGDVTRSTAVIAAVRRRYPFAKLSFLTSTSCLPVLLEHPGLNEVLTPETALAERAFDLILNLQNADPPQTFLGDFRYAELIQTIASANCSSFWSGRRWKDGGLTGSGYGNLYCRTELEEQLFLALEPSSAAAIDETRIYFPKSLYAGGGIELPTGRRRVAVFIGTASSGGHDQGFRTYSMSYLIALLEALRSEYSIVLVGNPAEKSTEEREQLIRYLEQTPEILDFSGKTSLVELMDILQNCDLSISTDSGPLHLSMALGTPTVGLFVNSASFRLSPTRSGKKYRALNSFEPCNERRSWRWKHSCLACQEKHWTRYQCHLKSIRWKQDLLPLENVLQAVSELVDR